jgi:SAM-dependent methyltransferase
MKNSADETEKKEIACPIPTSLAGAGTHERVLKLIEKYLPQSSRVVDLAAGEGAFSVELKRRGHEVLAVDASRESWKAPEIDLRVQNLDGEFADELLTENEKFDAVVAIEIIEHLENPFNFARQCAKLLKPNGLLFLSTPNVEAVFSRLIFLYTGRLNSFTEYETVRPAHITPIFKWKLEMLLEEAGFEQIWEEFNKQIHVAGTNLKIKASSVAARVLNPFLKGAKGDESRIVVARLKQ